MSTESELEVSKIMASLPRNAAELADLRRSKKFKEAAELACDMSRDLEFVAKHLNRQR